MSRKVVIGSFSSAVKSAEDFLLGHVGQGGQGGQGGQLKIVANIEPFDR
jgi:hypothetical protein